MTQFFDVVVARRRDVSSRITEFRLQHPHGQRLPALQPGSHLQVLTPSGFPRSYSLTLPGNPQPDGYEIAVALDQDSRGGSLSMHQQAMEGIRLQISAPQGGYLAEPDIPELLLVAGGVGITPVISLYRHLLAARARDPRRVPRLRVVYLVRTRAHAAYAAEFQAQVLLLHAADEHGGQRLNLWPLLAAPEGRRLFCCGPQPLLKQVRALTMHWRPRHLHFEDFGGVSGLDPQAEPFTAVWEPTGQQVEVSPQQTLLDALTAQGIPVSSSCRAGTCGTCRVRLLAGEVRHRDAVLDEQQRQQAMITCVSRGEGHIVIAPAYGGL